MRVKTNVAIYIIKIFASITDRNADSYAKTISTINTAEHHSLHHSLASQCDSHTLQQTDKDTHRSLPLSLR